MKNFDKWVEELREQINKKPDLPEGIVQGNVDGEYLYQCRSCGDWNPIDWDLDEDSYDGHYCGKGPSCCPLTPGAAAPKIPVGGQPQAAPPPPPPAHRPVPARAGMMHCPVCNQMGPINSATMHRPTGLLFCGSTACRNYMDSMGVPVPTPTAPVRPVTTCAGCNISLTNDQIVYDKVTGAPTCGRHTCMAFVQKRSKLF